MTTSLRVVFPAAISGIVAALILGDEPRRSARRWSSPSPRARRRRGRSNPLDPGGTMTSAMVAARDRLATRSPATRAAFQSLFFIGLLLFIITLVLNIVGDAFVRRARQRY